MDVVLRNGLVIDGSGATGKPADVAVADGRIVAVGDVSNSQPGENIDLDGLVLAPGFIDVHTHLDAQILWDPDLTPSSWHGVTTAIMGNCGFGIAPTRPEHQSLIIETLEGVEGMSAEALTAGIEWSFETFPEYLDALTARPKRLNVAAYLGHTPLRLYVMGVDASRRTATTDEVRQMRALASEALAAGAAGFATSKGDAHWGAGGLPVPSRLADYDEIVSIAEVLRDAGHGTATVTLGTDFHVDEAAALAKAIGRPVSWESAFTGFDCRAAHGSAPPGTALALVNRSANSGAPLWPQVSCRPAVVLVHAAEPYPLVVYSPAFKDIAAAPMEQRRALYEDPAWQERARTEIADRGARMWPRLTILETRQHAELHGKSLADIADAQGRDAFDILIELALEEDLETRFQMILMNDDEEELAQLLRHERTVLAGSDAGAHMSQLCDACFSTYFLAQWVREKEVFSLEEGVHRLTGQLAQVFGLQDRGLVKEGYAADLVAFDPEEVGVGDFERVWDQPAGEDRLIVRSHGIHHIWVNGSPIRRDGEDLALGTTYPGEVVRSW